MGDRGRPLAGLIDVALQAADGRSPPGYSRDMLIAQSLQEIERRLSALEARPINIETMTVSGQGSVGIDLGGSREKP